MTTTINPNAYDPARSQGTLVRDTLTRAMPRRGEPTLAWELDAEGTRLTGRGTREAVALTAGRVGGGEARDQINRGARSVTCTVPGFGTDAIVEFIVTG